METLDLVFRTLRPVTRLRAIRDVLLVERIRRLMGDGRGDRGAASTGVVMRRLAAAVVFVLVALAVPIGAQYPLDGMHFSAPVVNGASTCAAGFSLRTLYPQPAGYLLTVPMFLGGGRSLVRKPEVRRWIRELHPALDAAGVGAGRLGNPPR